MVKVLLRLVFLVHQIIGQSDIEDDYAALYIKAIQAGRVTRKSLSPQGSDISIINWVAVYADIARFDAIVPYHPTAIAILAPVEKRPEEEMRDAKNKHIAILHASYHLILNVEPIKKKYIDSLNKQMVVGIPNFSFDSLESTNMSTPEGIGNYIGKHVASIANSDGMNNKGDFGGKKYNLKHFEDYTGYKPVNSLNQVVDPTKWQPHVEYGSGLGVQIYSQHFITPQLGNLKYFGMRQKPNVSHILRRKSSHWQCTSWPCNDLNYKQQTDEVIQEVANITEKKKVLIEYFNDKLLLFEAFGVHAYETYHLNEEQLIFLAVKSSIAAYNQMVAVWKAKRLYDAARPFTAIRHLYGNHTLIKGYSKDHMKVVDDMPASDWESYITVANHPEYPSATAAYCGAQAQVLRLEGKSDNTNGFSWRIPKSSSFFEEGKPIKDEIIRFDTWTEWENQCAFSRLWGGLHYKDSVVDGVKLGRQFAAAAIDFVNSKINPKNPY